MENQKAPACNNMLVLKSLAVKKHNQIVLSAQRLGQINVQMTAVKSEFNS